MVQERILTIDSSVENLGSLQFSDKLDDYLKDQGHNIANFDTIRLKTELAVKEYTNKKQLVAVLPFFLDVRLRPYLGGSEPVEQYTLPTGAIVQIFKDDVGYLYNIVIPETNTTYDKLLEIKKEVEVFEESGESDNELIKRWYLGFGILEHLFSDKKILEINVNPPAHKTSMRIVHADYSECHSNIYPSDDFLNYISTRLRLATGRPFNRAQPQLDGELEANGVKARVAAIINPFSVFGTAYSIRKHREDPWTQVLFLKNKTVNSWFAGLMSFAIAHGRTFLTVGPRGSGKTSILGSLMLEILPKYRVITIEDTQELPIFSYKDLGYDIVPLKVRSALLNEGMEMPFDTGLRTSLRLGDSCLIIGEIRGMEAKVLYEAMRVGAMSNVVAGTIHGDSPFGVYDRVVNDLGVPKGSFKVTDLIIIVNQITDASGESRVRRVISVTEVLKDWEDTPKFQDLLVYDPQKDELVPTDALLNGKSVVIQQVLERSQGYSSYNDVLQDIKVRAWAKQAQCSLAKDAQLEASYVSKANKLFVDLFQEYSPYKSQEGFAKFSQEYIEGLKQLYGYYDQEEPVSEQQTDEQNTQ
ncbi:MAG: ATPase, T2SS/T4P/T4SS family [Candidatus Woesearchaeota archaeon]